MAHTHDVFEGTIFCPQGRGTVSDLTNGTDLAFEAGQTIHVPAGVEHAVKAGRALRAVAVARFTPVPSRRLLADVRATPEPNRPSGPPPGASARRSTVVSGHAPNRSAKHESEPRSARQAQVPRIVGR